eukprot:GHVT01104958.1.p1 GENE.GHVT01104958.1~~GHVT01104958.1.p1  ORF type:complete len:237 (+),score=36.22 GHVT01104958.1:903-1613(+)
MALNHHQCTSTQQRTFRQAHPGVIIRLGKPTREQSPTNATGGNVSSSSASDRVHGQATRPSTPITRVISNTYARVEEERAEAEDLAWQEQQQPGQLHGKIRMTKAARGHRQGGVQTLTNMMKQEHETAAAKARQGVKDTDNQHQRPNNQTTAADTATMKRDGNADETQGGSELPHDAVSPTGTSTRSNRHQKLERIWTLTEPKEPFKLNRFKSCAAVVSSRRNNQAANVDPKKETN